MVVFCYYSILICFFSFCYTLCIDSSTTQPCLLAEWQDLYFWLDALHTSNFMWVTALLHSSYAMSDTKSWKLQMYAHTHGYIYTHILNRFNFILFQLMTPADMSAALNNSSPFFPVLCLPQVSSADASGMVFDDCISTNVQVSSGAIYFSHSNIYADLALMTQPLFCSVRKLLPSLCKTRWALGGSGF